jgi:hypothetical protein
MEKKGDKREYRRLYVIEDSDTVLNGWSKKELRELGGRHYKNVKLNDDDISTTSVWKIPVDCRKIIESKVQRKGSDVGDVGDKRKPGSDIINTEEIRDTNENISIVPEEGDIKKLEIDEVLTPDIVKNSTTSTTSTTSTRSTNTTNTITVTVGTNTDKDMNMKIIQFSDYKLGAFQEIRDRCQQYSEMVEFTKSTKTK